MEWKPIETAPKDGTFIDVWVIHPERTRGGYRKTCVWWKSDDWRCYDGSWVEGPIDPITRVPAIRISHWMPLPEPPK